MSQFPNSNPLLGGLGGLASCSVGGLGGGWGSYGMGVGYPQTYQFLEGQAPQEPKKPPQDTQIDRTADDLYSGGAFNRFIGYPDAPPGFLNTYRFMDATSPVLTLARAAVLGPILGGIPTFEIRTPSGKTRTRSPIIGNAVTKDPLDQRCELIEQNMLPVWSDLIFDCGRALSLGSYPFEVVWTTKNGKNWIKSIDGIPPEWAMLLVDNHRDFVGIRPQIGLSGDDLIGVRAFNYAYDPEAKNWNGRPRHENARLEWWRMLQDDIQGSRLDDKAAGFVFVVKGPSGAGFVDQTGKPCTGQQACQAVAQLLTAGRSVNIPNFAFSIDKIIANPELAKATAFDIQMIDLGNSGPSQSAMLQKLQYRQRNLVMAWGRPSREVLEATSGGMGEGDSKTHGQIGQTDSEWVAAGMYRQINRGPINNLLRLNFGPDAVDSVFASAQPLADPQISFFQQLVLALMANQQAAQELLSRVDTPTLMDRVEIPTLETPKPMPKPIPVTVAPNPVANGRPVNTNPLPPGNRLKAGASPAQKMNGHPN